VFFLKKTKKKCYIIDYQSLFVSCYQLKIVFIYVFVWCMCCRSGEKCGFVNH